MRSSLFALACGSVLCSFALLDGVPHDRAGTPLVVHTVAPQRVAVADGLFVAAPLLEARVAEVRAVPSAHFVAGGGPVGPTGASGENALAPDGLCCAILLPPCPNTPGTYKVGDEVYFNSYWTEVLPADPGPNWAIGLGIGVKLPNGTLQPLVEEATIDFGDLSALAGLQIQFCVAVAVTIPPVPVPYGPVEHGFSVRSPQGVLAPTVVNSLSVN